MRFLIILLWINLFALQKVSLQLDWKYQFQFAGYIAAKEKGFYKDYGLDVKLLENKNNNIINKVISNQVTFGIGDSTPLILAKLNNKPVKLVSSFFKRSVLVIISRPNIYSLKDLEGKKLMALNKDIGPFFKIFKEKHIDINKIHFVPTTFDVKPFVEKKVDAFVAYITDEPYELDKLGIKYHIFNPTDYGSFEVQQELFTNDYITKTDPVMVANFVEASKKGWIYALNHKKEIATLIYNKYSKRKTIDALIDEANKLDSIIQEHIFPIGEINKASIKTQMQYLAKLNHKNVNIEKMVNDYIFEFHNPLHLSNKYLWLIKLYNFYLDNKLTIIVITIFSFIFIMMFVFIYNLRIKNKKIETLFNKVPVAYAIGDIKEKKIVYANDYAKKLFKVSNFDNIKGKKAVSFHIDEKSYQEFTNLWQNYLKKHNTLEGFSAIWQFKKRDGEIFWGKIYAVPYIDNQVIWVIFDVDELINTQHNLEKQMKVKEEFLANISHEIRTPLNAILGFIAILEKKESNEDNKRYLHIMKQSSQSLLNMLNDVLDFSKIEKGKVTIERVSFNPKELVDNISLFESKAKEKNIKLIVNTNNLDNYLISDVTKIKQIISNLISNAIKFSPENSKIICNINYENEKLYVEMIDEGIGISKDKLEEIFSPFIQADSSVTRKYGGTGLGLAISYKLVQLLKGKLKVKSEENKGSVFYFVISDIKIDNSKSLKDKNKILIVTKNKSYFEKLFSNFNYDVDIVNQIEEMNVKYDLIFIDEKDKMEAIKIAIKIKALGIDTPIIAIIESDVDNKNLFSVIDDYIKKPIDETELQQLLSKYLKDIND